LSLKTFCRKSFQRQLLSLSQKRKRQAHKFTQEWPGRAKKSKIKTNFLWDIFFFKKLETIWCKQQLIFFFFFFEIWESHINKTFSSFSVLVSCLFQVSNDTCWFLT
jgi:hypothetical protein